MGKAMSAASSKPFILISSQAILGVRVSMYGLLDAGQGERVATIPNFAMMPARRTEYMGPHISNISEVIQLAVAPVFLLTGVGATLNVLATRIGRIIDRARMMEDQLASAAPERVD